MERKFIRDLRIEGEERKEAFLPHEEVFDEKPKEDDKEFQRRRKLEKVRRRIKNSNPSRSLTRLAGIEAELSEHSAALAKLSESDETFAEPDGVASPSNNCADLVKASNFREKRPDKDLLVHQLTRLIPPRAVLGHHQAQRLQSDVIALHASMGSRNSLESILDRLIVGAEVAAFDCFDQAARTTNERARDVNLRNGMKAATTIINLMRFRDERRGQVSQSVTIGKLKTGQPRIGRVQQAYSRRNGSGEEFPPGSE